jgi:hypothetical protein
VRELAPAFRLTERPSTPQSAGKPAHSKRFAMKGWELQMSSVIFFRVHPVLVAASLRWVHPWFSTALSRLKAGLQIARNRLTTHLQKCIILSA